MNLSNDSGINSEVQRKTAQTDQWLLLVSIFCWPPVEAPSWESSKPPGATRVVPSRTSGEEKKTKQEKTSRELGKPVGTWTEHFPKKQNLPEDSEQRVWKKNREMEQHFYIKCVKRDSERKWERLTINTAWCSWHAVTLSTYRASWIPKRGEEEQDLH